MVWITAYFTESCLQLWTYANKNTDVLEVMNSNRKFDVLLDGTILSYTMNQNAFVLRWLDWIFLGRYFPSLSLNYVGMSKDIEKRLPQLYYIKMKISYDLGFIAIGVAMAT